MMFALTCLLLICSGLTSFADGSRCTSGALRSNLSSSIKSQRITVITTSDLSPYVSRIGKGVPFGLDIELMNYISYIYRIDFHYRFTTFPSIIPGVQADRNSISITAQRITDERLKSVDFAQYFRGGSGFLVRFNYSQTINGLTDLCGKFVAVQAGTIHVLDVQQQNLICGTNPINILIVPTLTQTLHLVGNGSADVFVFDRIVLLTAASDSNNQLKVVDAFYNVLIGGILCNKENTELCCVLVNAINHLIQQGIYQKLLKKYSFSLEQNGICPSRINLQGSTCKSTCRPTSSVCQRILN